MEKEKDLEWGSTPIGSLSERWPRDGRGEPEEPVFLGCRKNIASTDTQYVLFRSEPKLRTSLFHPFQ